jgi:tRNA pseudouridine55 synthase
MEGLLIIDKPPGMTSRDVVNRIQRLLPRGTKIGHTGTLDPLASGVLVLCIGKATKLADSIQALGKTYEARIRLGAASDTDDADGEIVIRDVAEPPSREAIEARLAGFVGSIEQTPPAYSAVKVGGRRAYTLARKGQNVELKPRTVRVDAIEVIKYDWPWLDLKIDCGKGTYIRSIARDLGIALGVGGMIETLRRTKVGPYTIDASTILENVSEIAACRKLIFPM